MAEGLSAKKAQLANKKKAEVEALLGKPVKLSRWKNAEPPVGATAAQVATFEAKALDEIWVYANGRVHFSASGKVLKVDDNVSKYFPPEPPGMIV